MKNFLKFFSLSSVLILTLVSTQGCFFLAGAAAGAGGLIYVRGNLQKNLDSSVTDVHDAALKTLSNMNMVIVSDELEPHRSVIKFDQPDGQSGQIAITALTERASKISVRIGLLGDETTSNLILSDIQRRL